jgi:hypothetical protein
LSGGRRRFGLEADAKMGLKIKMGLKNHLVTLMASAERLLGRFETRSRQPQSAAALGQFHSAGSNSNMGTSEEHALLQQALAEIRALRIELLASHGVTKLLAADILFSQQPRDQKHIVQATTHAYSQNYEDAIIAEIYSRIGEQSRFFVEIGIETGVECNTRALLERGWKGVWIDANPAAIEVAKSNMEPYLQNGALKIVEAMVVTGDVQKLLSSQLGNTPIDFLSVDVDHNTSHIWRAIGVTARVSCIEYNPAFPPNVEWEVPYDPDATWDGTNRYGASLKTLERIGREKGLALVGCDFHGVNAFFVNESECADKFLVPYTAEKHFEPARYGLVGHRGHPANPKAVSRLNSTVISK